MVCPTQIEENRSRMWAFMCLCILGLNIFQASGEANSTQMYYYKLRIERSAIANVTAGILQNFLMSSTDLLLDGLQMTTTCKSDEANTNCICESGFRWSDKVCQSNEKCCGNSNSCTFPKGSAHMCISNNTVTIKGSCTMKGVSFQDCLANENSQQFKDCNRTLLREMTKVCSTLRGFDDLRITHYRFGSIIADFEVTLVFAANSQDLINRIETLSKTLSASFDMETKGVVHLSMPDNPVEYNSRQELKCTSQTDLSTVPMWQLKKQTHVFKITNGTMSLITMMSHGTRLTLKNITEIWAGEYSCSYHQESKTYKIVHRASAVMDVALLPIIDISTDPGFPYCPNKHSEKVRGKCEIQKSSENYSVTWKSQGIETKLVPLKQHNTEDTVVYIVETLVNCSSSRQIPQLTCTFTNRRNQSKSASVDIIIISAGERFCEAEGDWQITKAGYSLVLKCQNEDGIRKRKCSNGATSAVWEQEESECVNREVQNVLQSANIVDIGLGSLDENTAKVFYQLKNVTNDTKTIDTFNNIKTSVNVLFTLKKKINIISKESAAHDLLDSSSSLMDESLQNSWKGSTDKDNFSVAETYMNTVEQLIAVTNVTLNDKRENIEVATCRSKEGSKYANTVFNVTVALGGGSDGGILKITGFKQLEKYLPHNETYSPNSIVVSAITEKKLGSVEVKIDFQLHSQRPRNVKMMCVTWDNTTRQWSENGCKWEGASNERSCVCSHLSSFAILMSTSPMEISLLTQITYVGLSVSIISLIISLTIEGTVWSAVVKTNTLYLRHSAHINISLCLLVADCCFLASHDGSVLSKLWCKTFTVFKHFCYLSMFFWMVCLSITLLHQTIFLFHNVSRKTYLRLSLILGYVCPLLIVTITFLTNNGGAEDLYFSRATCWLVYSGYFQGSIFTFIIPVGIIVFVNVISMLMVIMKLLSHPTNTDTCHENERKAAKTIIRSVILLTPVFGVTWLFGFAVLLLDLTDGPIAFVVNYAFTILNAFQGLFILLTTCLGDKSMRAELLKCLKKTTSASTTSSTKSQSLGSFEVRRSDN